VRQLSKAIERGATIAAVCSGAFTLAEAGLLDGRRATTHWQLAGQLAAAYPEVHVEPDALYVVDGPVCTSAGSAAALDLCLHLVRQAHGAEVANHIARRVVTPPHRDGGQAQYVESPMPTATRDGGLGDLLPWLVANLDQPLSVEDIARQALMSPRTFARRFNELTGTTPRGWLDQQRLHRAQQLLESTDATLDAIARQAGYQTTDTLRRHFRRARGITPDGYRRTFRNAEVNWSAVASV
jgi:AraC family transcriptional regulator, transcriptional activator FtrA